MTTYYILDPNADIYNVWNHRMGEFASDFDAEYNPAGFGYSNRQYALKRAECIRVDNGLLDIAVIDRDTLFEWLDVKDWAGYN